MIRSAHYLASSFTWAHAAVISAAITVAFAFYAFVISEDRQKEFASFMRHPSSLFAIWFGIFAAIMVIAGLVDGLLNGFGRGEAF